jgi:hypothetical protein
MQAVTIVEDLDVGKLLFGRVLQTLRQPRRESERAPVLEIDDDAFGRAIVAGGGGAGLVLVGDASLLEGGVDGRTVGIRGGSGAGDGTSEDRLAFSELRLYIQLMGSATRTRHAGERGNQP